MNPGPYMEERRKYLAVASRYEEDCKTNPTPEDLKRCAMALYNAVRPFAPDPEENRALLEVAKSKLEQVLESNQDDHDARFRLGLVIYQLVDLCIIYGEEDFDQYCKEALDHFNTLKAQAPDAYDADHWLKEIRNFMPFEENYEFDVDYERMLSPRSSLDSEEMVEKFVNLWPTESSVQCTKEDDVNSELMDIQSLEQACVAFEIEHANDPDNSDILKKWGTALRKLTDYHQAQTRHEMRLLAESRARRFLSSAVPVLRGALGESRKIGP